MAEKPKHKTEVTTKKDFQKGLHLKKKSKIIISNIDWGNISIYTPLLWKLATPPQGWAPAVMYAKKSPAPLRPL